MVRYRIVPERSTVSIEARSSLHPIHTRTDGLEGWLELEVQGGGRLNPTVEPKGHLELAVEQLRSGNALQDRELKRRIDARRHPRITGELRTMTATEVEGRYRVSGELTFIGVTRSYEDDMVLQVLDGGGLRLEGEATFDIRDFGMQPPRILMLKVEPEVKVRVELVAEEG